MNPIRKLLPLLLLVAGLPAQEDRVDTREQEIERRMKAEELGKEGEKRGDGELSEAELKHLTPEERLARTVSRNTSGLCRFVAAAKPDKLMPGQRGTLIVTAVLNGQAVMPFPAPVELLGARKQGLVDIGEISVRPAEPGTLPTAYQGRPVYDNFAVFEIPIVMSPGAEMGKKQQISLDLRFDLYDGSSAQPIGRFVDRVLGEVQVGMAPNPAVQGVPTRRPEPAAEGSQPATQVGSEQPKSPAAAGEGPGRVIAGQDPVAPAATPEPAKAEPAPAAQDWSAAPGGESGVPMPVWIGGGVVLLLLVLMVARRRS